MARDPQQRHDALRAALGEMPQRRVMKRCFMTGKQCIFPTEARTDELRVFLITPYGANLKAFNQWTLFPYLEDGYNLRGCVDRADEVQDIGYIVCEKICHVMQQSDLVIADVTFANPNVFYELGMAYGLERPIALICNTDDAGAAAVDDPALGNSLFAAETPRRILRYKGVLPLDADRTGQESQRLEEYVYRPAAVQRGPRALKVVVLEKTSSRRDAHARDGAPEGPRDDIDLDLYSLLEGAVGVAVSEIIGAAATTKTPKQWQQLLNQTPDEHASFREAQRIVIDTGAASFKKTAEDLEKSFCTIIDVSDNDPAGCFWLGYCHARGLDAIPVDRKPPKPAEAQPVAERSNSRSHHTRERLAFDIRALWYVEYDRDDAAGLKDTVRAILERLLERELPDRQKRAFWDRFPRESPIKIITGAIHSQNQNREMVGDWDVRTVSALVAYLPQVREHSTIELATPLYSPEHACLLRREVDTVDFLRGFRKAVRAQLGDASAIVIASADVNPATEYLLHEIYRLAVEKAFTDEPVDDFWGYIAVKYFEQGKMTSGSDEEGESFPRRFYRAETDAEALRGFWVWERNNHRRESDLLRPYSSENTSLLAHLVAGRRPGSDNMVVILNGTSGPATYALAQMLTGGGPAAAREAAADGQSIQAEQMLRDINEKLEDCEAVEAIVEVDVGAPADDAETPYTDTRPVNSWCWVDPPRSVGEPRGRQLGRR